MFFFKVVGFFYTKLSISFVSAVFKVFICLTYFNDFSTLFLTFTSYKQN